MKKYEDLHKKIILLKKQLDAKQELELEIDMMKHMGVDGKNGNSAERWFS